MADARHKRETNARATTPKKKTPVGLLAAPLALTATLAAVGVGVLSSTPETRSTVTAASTLKGNDAKGRHHSGSVSLLLTKKNCGML